MSIQKLKVEFENLKRFALENNMVHSIDSNFGIQSSDDKAIVINKVKELAKNLNVKFLYAEDAAYHVIKHHIHKKTEFYVKTANEFIQEFDQEPRYELIEDGNAAKIDYYKGPIECHVLVKYDKAILESYMEKFK
jgi:hypothetical protein